MMAPEAYAHFRRIAPMHVQIWRARPSLRAPHGSVVSVEGRIVRIFRDRDRLLHWGQPITFQVPVIDPGARSAPMLSGTIYHDWNRLGRARWLEAFLDSWQGKLQLVYSQVLPLRHPTWRPVCGPDARETLCAGTLEDG
jgi:hypothetical protein